MSTDLVISQLDFARDALFKAKTIQDTKKVLDAVIAAGIYAKRQGLSDEIIGAAHSIRTFALRQLGEMLAVAPKNTGAMGIGKSAVETNDNTLAHVPTLSELGIDRDISSLSQKIAALPIEQVEAIAAREKTIEDIKREFKKQKTETIKSRVFGPAGFETCTVDDLYKLVNEGRKYGTIYADPPWPYGNQATRSSTSNYYKDGMTLQEISSLPIKELAEDNSHLHLWTTNGFLFESKAIMEAWGFEYKSCFVWVKPEMGIGNYWRVSHEFMLFGLRGKSPFLDHSIKSWLEHKRGEHSAKPEVIRKMIEKVGSGPRLELFGRRIAEGWTVWGNQISRGIFDTDVPSIQ